MAGALRKYKTLLNGLIQIGGGGGGVSLLDAVLNNVMCSKLRDTVIQTIVLEKHIDGLADGSEHQAKLTSIQEDPAAVIHKWEAAMEIGLSNGLISDMVERWLKAQMEKQEQEAAAAKAAARTNSMTFTSSRFQQLPSDKDDVNTKLLQYRPLTNIITAEDNPNKNRAHVRMALEKSTLLAAKSHDMAATMGLAYPKAETDAMDEYEYLNKFLARCQFELGLTTLMQAQAAVIEDIKQQAKQTSSEFMTLANREMSQMVSLARANGYDATDFDDFETDRKRSKIIIRALRPEYKA